ncbi:MAG: hypothetical protein CMK32_02150 [Porticoccaceae bacterium]|nr:hypothetical protein [Porticoccaceae bacterium]
MSNDKAIRLDASRLYGFKIVSRGRQQVALDDKIGQKSGIKAAPSLSTLLGSKVGGKVGFKV